MARTDKWIRVRHAEGWKGRDATQVGPCAALFIFKSLSAAGSVLIKNLPQLRLGKVRSESRFDMLRVDGVTSRSVLPGLYVKRWYCPHR